PSARRFAVDVANLTMKLVVRAARRAVDRAVDALTAIENGRSRSVQEPRAERHATRVFTLLVRLLVSHFALLLSDRSLADCGESAPSAAFSPQPARSTFAAQGPRSACPRRARPAPR